MLSVVGIGPGSLDLLTERGRKKISKADVIIGHEKYINQIRQIIPKNVEVIRDKMGTEVERAKEAVRLSTNGKNVVVVSGGDAGTYGMAGIILEASGGMDVDVIPGITAASAVSAILGAPLSNDFAVISLSDLLIPWAEIEKKLESMAKMDLVVAIYNPSSKNRTTQLERAHKIFMRFRDKKTVVGIVRNAERDDCNVTITTLDGLLDCQIDMSTTIIIGSSNTKLFGNRMVSRRGYERKYEIGDEISKESRAISQNIVCSFGRSTNEQKVAESVVIANGDPSIQYLLIFKGSPVERGIQCINGDRLIITDIEMVKTGINKSKRVLCLVNDPMTLKLSKKEGMTRTAAGIKLARERIAGNIVVIGNSPTACLELSRIVESGIKPSLIIATPVGFVNAAKSKEKILNTDIPCIAIKGTRGGTPSAVAIINEIIKLAGEN